MCISNLIPDRDGQKRPVYIYRLLTTGTIDGEQWRRWQVVPFKLVSSEKIYQRQVTKMGLSDCELRHEQF